MSIDAGATEATGAEDLDAPLTVVSCDTHIGPLLEAQLGDYCPPQHRDAFEAFAAEYREARDARVHRNMRTAGHFDMHARLRDMNNDGVAAEVIFHGSINPEPLPFGSTGFSFWEQDGADRELLAVGLHMYNQWLADVCSIEPERHVGLAYLPMWDPELARKEMEWARNAGLKGVNFPAPRPDVPDYDNPIWDDFWSAVEDLDVPLTTHGGAGRLSAYTRTLATLAVEAGGPFARLAVGRMLWSGVFDRHPGIKLVLVEQPGLWWTAMVAEYNSIWLGGKALYEDELMKRMGGVVPRLPEEYFEQNVFVGGSFLAPFEAETAVAEGYSSNLMWGSDYPHPEGCFQCSFDDAEDSVPDFHKPPTAPTNDPRSSLHAAPAGILHLAMRHTFADVPGTEVRRITGDNAMRIYGLDRAALADVAQRISSPTLRELAEPIDSVPERGGFLSFRKVAAWG